MALVKQCLPIAKWHPELVFVKPVDIRFRVEFTQISAETHVEHERRETSFCTSTNRGNRSSG